MNPNRLTVARMMRIVCLIAANFAAAQMLFPSYRQTLLGIMPAAVGLQVAILLRRRARGRARAFWTEFLLFGALALGSFVWAMTFPRSIGITTFRDPGTGKVITRTVVTPGSPMSRVWDSYGRFVNEQLERFDFFTDVLQSRGGFLYTILALIWLLPQWLIAALGGLLAWGLASVRDKRRTADAVISFPAA
jgi:hypothetical protein